MRCTAHSNAQLYRRWLTQHVESVRLREFDQWPLLVIWEVTQACDLSCMHCPANAQPKRHALELSTAEAFHLVDQISDMRGSSVLTGGDPLKRPDLLPIVQYACRRGVRTSLTPSATPLLTRKRFPTEEQRIDAAGVKPGRLKRRLT